MGRTTGVKFQAGAEIFSFRHVVRTYLGANPTSYPMGTGE